MVKDTGWETQRMRLVRKSFSANIKKKLSYYVKLGHNTVYWRINQGKNCF